MKEYTINGWCEIFGIELVDLDGPLRSHNPNNGLISLERFVAGIVECTIRPLNNTRYKVLEMLW